MGEEGKGNSKPSVNSDQTISYAWYFYENIFNIGEKDQEKEQKLFIFRFGNCCITAPPITYLMTAYYI